MKEAMTRHAKSYAFSAALFAFGACAIAQDDAAQGKRIFDAHAVTSGGVLFTGDLNNNFLVLDATNGNTLYRFQYGRQRRRPRADVRVGRQAICRDDLWRGLGLFRWIRNIRDRGVRAKLNRVDPGR